MFESNEKCWWLHSEEAGARAALPQPMRPQELLCADEWWFLTSMGPGSIVTEAISAVSPRGLPSAPSLPETLAKEDAVSI